MILCLIATYSVESMLYKYTMHTREPTVEIDSGARLLRSPNPQT